MILFATSLIPDPYLRIKIVGWTNVVFSVCVFAAPLSIMVREFIHTKPSIFVNIYGSIHLIYHLLLPFSEASY